MREQEQYVHYLRINPTYSVLYKRNLKTSSYSKENSYSSITTKSIKQLENEKNLKENSQNGVMSEKAAKKLKNAINWLVLSATHKTVKNNTTGKNYKFKVNFITLTLPFEQENITDNTIKKELLNPFFMFLKNRYDFKTYVWKAESQKNGNIHFHIASDCFIPHNELRYFWNRLIAKKGYMSEYSSKFSSMSLEDYQEYSYSQGITDKEVIRKRFLYGKSTNWENPNSTDVHAVEKVDNIAAYLASYMSKKEDGKRPIQGRLWGCSQNISDENKLVVEIYQGEVSKVLLDMEKVAERVKDIETEPDTMGKKRHLATLFIANLEKVLKSGYNEIKKVIVDHIIKIRNWQSESQLNFGIVLE